MKLLFTFLLLMFLECGSNINYIKIKGSDTEVNLVVRLAEEFHKVNAGINISVTAGLPEPGTRLPAREQALQHQQFLFCYQLV